MISVWVSRLLYQVFGGSLFSYFQESRDELDTLTLHKSTPGVSCRFTMFYSRFRESGILTPTSKEISNLIKEVKRPLQLENFI
jgi:hypothetical protein